MNQQLQSLRPHGSKLAAAIALATAHTMTFAAAGGGLAKATSAADEIKTGLIALVAVLAVIYLIVMGVLAFSEKKSWSDFGWAVFYVSLVGAAGALGTWAWTVFQ